MSSTRKKEGAQNTVSQHLQLCFKLNWCILLVVSGSTVMIKVAELVIISPCIFVTCVTLAPPAGFVSFFFRAHHVSTV